MVFKGVQIGLLVQFQRKRLYLKIHFTKGHHTPNLITLSISVIEASYLQFCICQLIVF